MKTELYYYAKSITAKKDQKPPYLLSWLVLGIFWVAILLLFKIRVGLVILAAYVFLFLYVNKQEERFMLSFGLWLLFLGIEASCFVLIDNMIKLLIISVIIFMLLYEIVFILRLKLKYYSRKTMKTWGEVILMACAMIGFSLGRLVGKMLHDADLTTWIITAGSAGLIVGAVTFFQKHFIYKIMKNNFTTPN